MADTAHNLQFDQFLPHQPQAPPLSFLWLLSTQQRDQVGFGLAIQFPLVGARRLGPTHQGSVESLLEKAFAHALHRAPTHRERLDDLGGRPAWALGATVDMQQNLRMPDLVGWGYPLFRQTLQGSMLPFASCDAPLGHAGLLVWCTSVLS